MSKFAKKGLCINKFKFQPRDRIVEVGWTDGHRSSYPSVWLRDSCLCKLCHNFSATTRILTTDGLDTDVEPTATQIIKSGAALTCNWSDGHYSEFPSDWLRSRSFNAQDQLERIKEDDPPKMTWNNGYVIPEFSYGKAISDDLELYNLLKTLHLNGLVMLKDCPGEKHFDAVNGISKRAVNSSVFRTHYGEYDAVVVVDNPSNITYTNVRIPLHTDQPYLKYCPNIQVLHCVRQCTEGGANEFADGFYVARLLQQTNPDAYRLLTTTLMDYHDIGNETYDFHMKTRRPIIDTNRDGDMIGIYYNGATRDYASNIPLRLVQPFYEALDEFDKLLYANNIVRRMVPGDMVLYDNNRVLHARQEVTSDKKENGRRLEVVYWSWDEVKSRICVLRKKINEQEA